MENGKNTIKEDIRIADSTANPAPLGLVAFSGRLEKGDLVSYLTLWGLFSFVMFVITFKLPKALQVVFGLLTTLLIFLIRGNAAGKCYCP